MSQSFEVQVSMSAGTSDALELGAFYLYGFRAVKTMMASARPTVWWRGFGGGRPEVIWSDVYEVFISSSPIVRNEMIRPSFTATIDLGQTLQIQPEGVGKIVDMGIAPNAFSIVNQTTQPYTCGIGQSESGASAFLPLVALPMYGNMQDIIAPTEVVLLIYSTSDLEPGTVVDQMDSPGILIDLANTNLREVVFDINMGWSWGGYAWAKLIPVNTNLIPFLIIREEGPRAESPDTSIQ